MPYGKSNMRDMESFLVGDDADDVAVMDVFPVFVGVAELRLGDEGERGAVDLLFHLSDGRKPLAVGIEHLVGLHMGGHVVDVGGALGRERRLRQCDILDKSVVQIVSDPSREIMLS